MTAPLYIDDALIGKIQARSYGAPDVISEDELRFVLTTFLDIWRGGWKPGNPILPGDNRIPCAWTDLEDIYANVGNIIPTKRKQLLPYLRGGGGELHDPWAVIAEATIVRDLKKFSTPMRLDDINNLDSLRYLKCYKVLELLFRMNRKEEGDKFDIEYKHFRLEYSDELENHPYETNGTFEGLGGANVALSTGIIRGS